MEKSEEGRRRKSGEEETVSNITHRYTYTHTHTHTHTSIVLEYIILHLSLVTWSPMKQTPKNWRMFGCRMFARVAASLRSSSRSKGEFKA